MASAHPNNSNVTLLAKVKDGHCAARYLRQRIETHTLDEADGLRLTRKVIDALDSVLQLADLSAAPTTKPGNRRGFLTILEGGRP